jgi:hypothetical protein
VVIDRTDPLAKLSDLFLGHGRQNVGDQVGHFAPFGDGVERHPEYLHFLSATDPLEDTPAKAMEPLNHDDDLLPLGALAT